MLATRRQKSTFISLRARRGRLPCLVHCRNSRGEVRRFLIRKCRMTDLSDITALQDEIMAALPDRDLLAYTTADEFAQTLAEDYCIGAYRGGRLVMFSNMILNQVTPRHLGVHLGYSEEQVRQSVIYDTTFVASDFRGFGLQRLASWFKNWEARKLGAKEAIATVSPHNDASLRNIVSNGFTCVERREMYGGVDRLVMKKRI